MEFAGRVLITSASLMHLVLLRITRPRSDLSCHHRVIAQATIGETSSSTPFLDIVIRPVRLRARASGGIVGPELAVFGQQRPRDPGVLVGLCDRCYVRVASTEKALKPASRQLALGLRDAHD